MFENIDDITVDYEEDGRQLVQEMDKVVLSKGQWTTILFRYRQYDPKLDDFGPDRYSIRRYRKMSGSFKPQSKFTISSAKQAKMIVETLNRWVEESGAE
ncbi:hypothetical protein dsx2_0499 [Desulfovibrio sp. X2]|uniref:hypothetical protein n=1 Tax=Desulfovibrio sp. X2 TaxID=941449 RepID=UPI000358EA75|nr:hypothetical protein [Desulfovibrio sp. X2]EPR38690.1 hypothetical protein dsx2_0499 [Desulfovibrio sp. X2]